MNPPSIKPDALALEIAKRVVTNFPHKAECNLHSLVLQHLGKKLARPTEVRAYCQGCFETVPFPSQASFVRTWHNLTEGVNTDTIVIDVEATVTQVPTLPKE